MPVALLAVAVLVVAVAAIGVVVIDVRSAPVLQAPTDAEGVPVRYPNGAALPAVPGPLAGGLDRPVVVAGSVEDPLGELPRCAEQVAWEFAPTLRTSVITPEGLTVSIRGEEHGTEAIVHISCYAVWSGPAWQTWASWVGDAPDPSAPVAPPEPVCCRDDGLALAGGETRAPEGAAWLAQDRGAYWLAYPVGDGGLVHPVWPVEGGQAGAPPTVFLDAAGRRVGDEPPTS